MAFYSDWSDLQRWVMGVIGTLLTSVLGFLMVTLIVPKFFPPSPEPNGLTRKARLVVEHVGDKDPYQEGFESGKPWVTPEQQQQWKNIKLTASQNPRSWRVENPILGYVVYIHRISSDQLSDARSTGWRMTLQTRLLKLTDQAGGINANFDTGHRRYDLNVLSAFPASSNPAESLVVQMNYIVGAVNKVQGKQGANESPIDGGRSHQYIVTYDSITKTVVVYVDEKEVLRQQGFEGHPYFSFGSPVFAFGTSAAEATFELVRFEVFE